MKTVVLIDPNLGTLEERVRKASQRSWHWSWEEQKRARYRQSVGVGQPSVGAEDRHEVLGPSPGSYTHRTGPASC